MKPMIAATGRWVMAKIVEKAVDPTTVVKQLAPSKLLELTNILVATDFSSASDRALDYALSLARRYDSRIILAHVIPSTTDINLSPEMTIDNRETGIGAAEEEMGQILVSGRLRGVSHETVIEEGKLWPTLEALIAKYQADLVVVGSHKATQLRKVVLGSGAEEIFRQASCPVLIVGPAFEKQAPKEVEFKNIVLATDFGGAAEREAALAFSLAQEFDANVTLLHVVSSLEAYSETDLALTTQAISHELAQLVPPGSEFWCKPDIRVEIGEPEQETLKVAREKKADLLVIGAKRKKGVAAGHGLSSIAYRLVGGAPCPVLTVRS
jgi:nucleotide-binding universal stress UspA family protein